MNKPDFILASGSARRRELLQQIGAQFVVQPADIPEHVLPNETPEAYVTRLALEKAQAVYQQSVCQQPVLQKQGGGFLPVMGSDTSVVLGDQILGKPESKEHCIEVLMQLSGNTHRVLSGIAMVQGEQAVSQCIETIVQFRTLTKEQCERYWHTGEPADKAGGYGIQGLAAVFVERIEGSYSNVVGLPLAETADLLRRFNIDVWKG